MAQKKKSTIVSQQFNDKYLELLNPTYNEITREWVECENCGFVWRDPLLDIADTKNLYDKFRDTSFRNESPDDYFERITNLRAEESGNSHKVTWLSESLSSLLLSFFKNLRANLKKSGYLYIEVPSLVDFDDKSLPPDHDRFLMQHLWYFSPEILNKIATDVGFKARKMETRKTIIGKERLGRYLF